MKRIMINACSWQNNSLCTSVYTGLYLMFKHGKLNKIQRTLYGARKFEKKALPDHLLIMTNLFPLAINPWGNSGFVVAFLNHIFTRLWKQHAHFLLHWRNSNINRIVQGKILRLWYTNALGLHVNFGIKTLIIFVYRSSLFFPVRKEETVISRNVRDMKMTFWKLCDSWPSSNWHSGKLRRKYLWPQ